MILLGNRPATPMLELRKVDLEMTAKEIVACGIRKKASKRDSLH